MAEASVRAVLSMLVVLVVGIAFAYSKKIDQAGLASVGQAISYLYVPAILFYSFGKGLSLDMFSPGGGAVPLILLGAVSIPISALVAYPFMRCSRSPDWFTRWFLFGCTFQNTLALPLVLVQTICMQIEFTTTVQDQVSNNSSVVVMSSNDCIATAQTYLFLYVFVNSLAFWVIAYDVMPSKYDTNGNAKVGDEQEEEEEVAVVAVPSDNEDPPLPTSSSSSSPPASSRPQQLVRHAKWLVLHCAELCLRPPIIAQLAGTLVGLVPALQEAFFSPTSYLSPITVCFKIFAEASTAVTNLSMASSLGLQIFQLQSYRHVFGGGEDGLSVRATWAFVFTRMLAIPGVLFACIYGAIHVGWIPGNNRLLQITAYLVSCMPSANMCVVVPQILGNHRASGALGLLVLGQYLVAIPSLLVWLSLAFYLTAS